MLSSTDEMRLGGVVSGEPKFAKCYPCAEGRRMTVRKNYRPTRVRGDTGGRLNSAEDAMLVGGVDFSGAKTVPNDTWLVTGELDSLGLHIKSVKNTGSHALAKELDHLKELSCVAMDFPFSLPAEFLKFLARKIEKEEFQEWQHAAEPLVFMSFEQFKQYVDEYEIVALRYTDSKSLRVAKSPLNTGNPSMVQMSFYGMRMLATFNPEKYAVLPFQEEKRGKVPCNVIEIYPREVLYILGLPDQGYKMKDKKNHDKAHAVRKEIVDGLIYLRETGGEKFQNCPRLHIDNSLKGALLASDHTVDALVACYGAALYHERPQLFDDPWESDSENMLVEGWIYGPRKLVPSKEQPTLQVRAKK
jgi:hypothetical protein